MVGQNSGVWDRLWPQVRSGDDVARGKLFDAYRNYLILLVKMQLRKRLQGKVTDSDVVQQTFLEAHRDLHQFRGAGEAEFMAWLRKLLATNIANQLRHFFGTQRRQPLLERKLQAELNESSAVISQALFSREESPSQHAARRERSVMVADAVAALPTDYRDVIIGRHFEGLTFSELADRMGRTEDSVQKLWVRGLAQLESMLTKTGAP